MSRGFAIIFFCFLVISQILTAQNLPNTDAIRKQMAKIRQTTDWNDPVAAKKANEEIKKLAQQLSGGQQPINYNSSTPPTKPETVSLQVSASNKEMVEKIADRFYQRAYKQINAIAKAQYDNEFKKAKNEEFNAASVRRLTSSGAFLSQFGDDPNVACTYLAVAVKINPQDTLSVNNFGAFLRMIDSTKTALSVHLYANQLCSKSPVILTQIGCSYFELKDNRKAEEYLKEALKYNANFGQAHTALCELYLQTGRWRDALQQLFAAVVGNGISYGQAHNNFAAIKNAAQSSPSGNNMIQNNVINQNSTGNTDTKSDLWGENNLQINPSEMLASLDPDANIPDNEKLAPLVPPDNRLKMPGFSPSSQLQDWTQGGGYNEGVNGYQAYMNTLTSFNSDFQRVHQSQPAISPNAILRDYPNERFAIDCILEYFRHQSDKEFKAYSAKVTGLPEQAGFFLQDYFKKLDYHLQQQRSCLEAADNSFRGCMAQCENYENGSKAKEACSRNCAENKQYMTSECNRLFCLNDCQAANSCNKFMNGVYSQFYKAFADHKKKQEELLNDLYGFTDKWLARIYSPYWSKIYAYEINREALGIIGNVYVSYLQPFQGTVTSDCGVFCSEYLIQPQPPVGRVITKEMLGNKCPPMGKHKFGLGPCDLGFDCESVEFGCTEGISASIKRNFKKKTTTGFLGVGVKGDAGFISGSAKAGIEVTVNDNNEVEDVGAKMDIGISTGWGPAKVGATSSAGYTVMTGLNAKPSWGISGKAK